MSADRSRRSTLAPTTSFADDGLAAADEPVVALGGLDGPVGRRGDRDLLLRHAHPAELDAQRLQLQAVALRAGALGHRPQAVEDATGQPDRLRELVVEV